jgi:hypothetical protein
MNTSRESRWGWLQYAVIYAVSALICWVSLAGFLANGGKYFSVLSFTLFLLEELYRYCSGDSMRTLAGPASLLPVAAAASFLTFTAWLTRSPNSRVVRLIVASALALATLVWLPNPYWGNM